MILIVRNSKTKLKNNLFKSNLGDLLRSLILLDIPEIKKDYKILTDNEGKNFLKYFIDEKNILTLNQKNIKQYINNKIIRKVFYLDNFDWCYSLLGDIIDKDKFQGILFENNKIFYTNKYLSNIIGYNNQKVLKLSWQESIIKGLNFKWEKQRYPKTPIKFEEKYQVGLNWKVDWVTKRLENDKWRKIYNYCINNNISVSWQQGINSIKEYIKWIASCKIIITIEGLGLHISAALNKKVILISGPCESNEYAYNNQIVKIYPKAKYCMPCNSEKCKNANFKNSCLEEININRIIDILNKAIKGG